MMRLFIGLASALALVGCATSNMSGDWGNDCEAQEGWSCRSISDIQSTIVEDGESPQPKYLGSGPRLEFDGVPMWETDQIMKIHVGAFVDAHNIFHEESVIYVVVSDGGWSKKPDVEID